MFFFLIFLFIENPAFLVGQSESAWPTYGGDDGGQRYSTASQINLRSISNLKQAWVYHTNALKSTNHSVSRSDFEATPILFHNTLYLTTPFDRVIALDAEEGTERWTYDPRLPDDLLAANFTSRGVAVWSHGAKSEGDCQSRIFLATLDARLLALDAQTGHPCTQFGASGTVDLTRGVPTRSEAPYRFFGNTSPPTVVGDVVVVGSAVVDNQAVDVEAGYVRGFDAISGKLLWTWDSMPWAKLQKVRTGGGNAWGVISADVKNGLIYIPTGAPSPDFYGGLRPGDNADANSIVAIDAASGRKVWAFQLVHHDVWDYDVASEPLLFEFQGRIPAVAIASKVGIVFVFNRLTGAPLYPIEERVVPKSDIPGELLSPTQPFSSLPPLSRQTFEIKDLQTSDFDTSGCADRLRNLRYEGVFTPPGLKGTLQYPGSLGGVNWASMALDPETGTLYANTNGSAYEIRLIPQPTVLQRVVREHLRIAAISLVVLILAVFLIRRTVPRVLAASSAVFLLLLMGYAMQSDGTLARLMEWSKPSRPAPKYINSPDAVGEVSPQMGSPYRIYRKVLQDDDGRPCTPRPWGKTVALNLNTGKFVWERPLGTMISSLSGVRATGTVSFGAPVITRGGLLLTAGSQQPTLFALNSETGQEVWRGDLPGPAQSTPMTYTIRGKQFVVVDVGGHGGLGTKLGDSVVAFSIPSRR